MPTGYYKRTAKHGQIISKALKKIGHRPPRYSGSDHPQWKGGRIYRGGYIYLRIFGHPNGGKQGYVAEHRLIMEKHIGRFLDKKEAIHHIDHNKTNNSIENLELCATHGQHTKLHHPEVAEKSRRANRGMRRSIATEFKKGQVPWNKKAS